MAVDETLLATLALLGGWRPRPGPREASIELVEDGWQVWDGQSSKPVPVHCDIAWEIAERDCPGGGAVVTEQTRKLCGDLRLAAKRPHISLVRREQLNQTVSDLRSGLARIRSLASEPARDEERVDS